MNELQKSHRWNVHYDRLSEHQHHLIALPFDAPALVSGPPGSGLTTVVCFRIAALLQAGPAITRPRPVLLCTSVTRASFARHLLGPLAGLIDIRTATSWLVERYVTATGNPRPSVGEVDWMNIAVETVSSGAAPARSVVLDDAHHLSSEVLGAIAVSTIAPFVTAHSSGAHFVETATGMTISARLNRRRRQPRSVIEASAAWGGSPPVSDNEGRANSVGIRLERIRVGQTVREALRTWRHDTSKRVAIVPLYDGHIPKIADMLVGLGLGSARLFSSDLPASAKARFDVGKAAVYVLRPAEMEGLEFDDVFVTSAEAIVGDLSESGIERRLQAIANAVGWSLTVTWDGKNSSPPIVSAITIAGLA